QRRDVRGSQFTRFAREDAVRVIQVEHVEIPKPPWLRTIGHPSPGKILPLVRRIEIGLVRDDRLEPEGRCVPLFALPKGADSLEGAEYVGPFQIRYQPLRSQNHFLSTAA